MAFQEETSWRNPGTHVNFRQFRLIKLIFLYYHKIYKLQISSQILNISQDVFSFCELYLSSITFINIDIKPNNRKKNPIL